MIQNDFKIIILSSSSFRKNEPEEISELLSSDIVDCLHIRKPLSSIHEIRKLIENIPCDLRKYLRLHDHFELLNEFDLAGVHINSRSNMIPSSALSISRSCHNLEELSGSEKYCYITLSPIYDSISKKGYRSKFDIKKIQNKLIGKNVVALGGVEPSNFFELRKAGFYGAAMLGAVWNGIDKSGINSVIAEISYNRQIPLNY